MKQYFKETKTINTLPSRAYFIPFDLSDKKSNKREDSSRFVSLNGTWKIEAFESFLDVEEFYKGEGDKDIPVPSCVQYYGYDYMQYTNYKYPFSYNPPHIPNKNPCFHYSRHFDWSKDNAYLVFEGVDSCFYVYLNGHFVGYSSISHRISEFDITPFVKEKDNKLDVLVLKWNKGSYLEDQDKWRFTGIFRDVYLLSRKEKHITDFVIKTKVDGTVTFLNKGGSDVTVTFNDETKLANINEEITFKVDNPKLWSAENPYLYDMEIKDDNEVIYQKVGICQSEVKDGIYLFNGKSIKLYGVNRHDFHPERGCAVSYEDMKKDILLMKSLNVNALRTSHYPSSPLLYELCNEYGIYVMSESDLENHGTAAINEPGLDYHKSMHLLSDNESFLDSVLERQVCNYEEHKNFSCINIYSIGNESGWGKNFIEALKLWKKMTNKPVHYEGLWEYFAAGHNDEYYDAPIDMVSRMYPEPGWIKNEYLNDKRENRPLVLCEYMHSMANPGGMKEYWDVINSSDRIMGAYVWEWADHGARYLTKYQNYGGDYGEFEHDGNFCIDGIVSTDREIRSATLAMKKAYQPLSFNYENNELTVFNKNYFESIKGTLIINDHSKEIKIAPREEIHLKEDGDLAIRFIIDEKEVARAQFINEVNNFSTDESLTPTYSEKGHQLIVSFNNNQVIFDKDSGEIESGLISGEHLSDIRLNIYRAGTDNDMPISWKWKNFYLNHIKSNVNSYQFDKNKLIFDISLLAPGYFPIVTATLTYEFLADGVSIAINYKLNKKEYFEYLPRIGLRLNLDKSYKELKYKAYGPYESYSDSYVHLFKDEYVSNVDDEYHHYVRPQESGSHYRPDYMCLSNGVHKFIAQGMTSFSALPYSIETLDVATHDEELVKDDLTHICLDYYMTGMGTGACGPLPKEEYRTPNSGNGKIIIKIN